MSDRDRVVLDDPPRASLLAILLRGLLATNCADASLWERARRLRGDVLVEAGGMRITLRFAAEGPTVLTGAADGRPRARVRGSLPTFVALATGGGVVGPVLSGAVRIGGNPLFLLKMLPLIRAPRADQENAP